MTQNLRDLSLQHGSVSSVTMQAFRRAPPSRSSSLSVIRKENHNLVPVYRAHAAALRNPDIRRNLPVIRNHASAAALSIKSTDK